MVPPQLAVSCVGAISYSPCAVGGFFARPSTSPIFLISPNFCLLVAICEYFCWVVGKNSDGIACFGSLLPLHHLID